MDSNGFFYTGKVAEAWAILNLVPRLWKSGATPQVPLHALMAWAETTLHLKLPDKFAEDPQCL